MIHLTTGLIVVWAAGFLFLLARAFNFVRLALNNPASDQPYWEYADYARFYFDVIFQWKHFFGLWVDPAKLTEVGRQYQKKAFWTEWAAIAWLVTGGLIVWAFSSFMAT
jgi:hypothetical protein